ELAPAGAGAWAERATRRKCRSSYRLAFVPSKFRVGEEPDPFIFEIDLASEPWSLLDVTAEVEQAGREALEQSVADNEAKTKAAAETLAAEVVRRAALGDDLLKDRDAVPLLMSSGLKRAEARRLVDEQAGIKWVISTIEGRR